MCGFVAYENATIREYPDWMQSLEEVNHFVRLLKNWPTYQAYPAFGKDITKTIPLLIYENNEYKLVKAIWWFDAYVKHDITHLGHLTSFNARNLVSRFWRVAIQENRGVVLASELGESKVVGKTKHRYLMQSDAPFLLGAVYQKLENGDYCCAIITRDSHPKMEPYHDKAFPLFLPNQLSFIRQWTSKDENFMASIEPILSKPKLYPNLLVQRVKTYKNKQTIGNIRELLISDLASDRAQ